MRIELIRRPERSAAMGLLSPLIAIALTVVAGFIVFTLIGVDPFEALYVYFIEPLTADWSLEDLVVKAVPLIMIAVGLSVCYQSNSWNIGAEGQLAAGAIFGSILPIYFPDWHGPTILPLMLILGVLGGMAYGAIPALLKTRLGANEILTSLMLVYVAQLILDWLARGPWRDPAGHNFPDSRVFDDGQSPPVIFGHSIRLNLLFVLLPVGAVWFLSRRPVPGIQQPPLA